jgi:hypothetical protein
MKGFDFETDLLKIQRNEKSKQWAYGMLLRYGQTCYEEIRCASGGVLWHPRTLAKYKTIGYKIEKEIAYYETTLLTLVGMVPKHKTFNT